MSETTTIAVPLWTAVVAACSVLGSAIGGTIWVMQTFQTKHDARNDRVELQERIDQVEEEAIERSRQVETKIEKVGHAVNKIGQDVSYIRGQLEKDGLRG